MTNEKVDVVQGLRTVANWFDMNDERVGNMNDEVQVDLRKWANEWEEHEAAARRCVTPKPHIPSGASPTNRDSAVPQRAHRQAPCHFARTLSDIGG